MGADGHIRIYDYEILKTIIGKEPERNAQVYIHTIFGKKVVTEYWGDNLSWVYCVYCGKPDFEHQDDGSDKYQKSEYVKHQEIVKPAIIESDWEVWT